MFRFQNSVLLNDYVFSYFYFLFSNSFFSCDAPQEQNRNAGRNLDVNQTDLIEDLSAQIVSKPNDPNLYIKRAMAYRNRQMMNLAIRDAQRALVIDSTVSYFHTVLGELEFQSGQLRDARLSLEKAVVFDETNTDAYLKLAETNFLLRRYDEAIINTNNALKIDDKLGQGYFIKGFIYKELGDTTLAKSSFQTATEVNPEHYEAFMELGNLSAHQGDAIALEYFKTALEIKPKSAEALYNLGMFYQAGQKFDDAMSSYRSLINIGPENYLGYYNTGYLYLTEYGEFKTAIAYFDTVLTLEPAFVDAMYNRGLCFEELDDTQQAIKIYKNILEFSPDYTLAAKGLDRLL